MYNKQQYVVARAYFGKVFCGSSTFLGSYNPVGQDRILFFSNKIIDNFALWIYLNILYNNSHENTSDHVLILIRKMSREDGWLFN